MALPFYAVEAHGGQVITLDDEAVVKDQTTEAGAGGNAYTAFVRSTSFDIGLDGGYSRLRRAVQHIHAEGAVTAVVTPYRDQMESGNTTSRTLAIGDNEILVFPLSETGTNFAVKMALSSFDALAELGKASQFVVPRRSVR